MKNAGYVDGFVLPISHKNTKAYTKMAQEASKVWKKYGALAYFECKGDDIHVKQSDDMKVRYFDELAGAGKNEDVWFSFVVYKNKKHRDAVNKKVMAYFSKKYEGKMDMPMPFDASRMAYGGFKAVVRN